MRGATEALTAAGLSAHSEGICIREIPHTRAAGADEFKSIWAGPHRPTAIVCFSDMMAYGVLDAARAIGVSIPGDVSVAGFDDLLDSALVTPSLTTVRQPIETKGRLAAEYLVDAIAARRPDGTRRDMLKTTLLVRDSTAAAKPARHDGTGRRVRSARPARSTRPGSPDGR
jgi:DNA-binding LacI/PurR family transcriptional regulator